MTSLHYVDQKGYSWIRKATDRTTDLTRDLHRAGILTSDIIFLQVPQSTSTYLDD